MTSLPPKRTAMSLEHQLADIARVPMLTCDEEIILGNRVQNMLKVLRDRGIDEQISKENFSQVAESLDQEARQTVKTGLKARDRMISANMRLVVAVAKKIKTSQLHMTIQDMIQEGAIGLARAAEKFEPGRGYKFSTYAYWWIRQSIARASEYQEKTIRVPATIQKTAKRIKDAREELILEMKKEPTIPEIAAKMGEDPDRIRKIMLLNASVISLDSGIRKHGDSAELAEVLPADQEDQDCFDESPKLEILLKVLDSLPDNEKLLMKQRYGIGMTALSVKDVAAANESTEQEIRQKYQEIAKKMKFVANIFIGRE